MKLKNLLDKLIKSSQRINRYYSLTNFYSFLLSTVIKGLILFFLFILLIFCIDFFFIDLELLIKNSFEKYSSVMLMSIFFISESFLGLIPPELFLIWSTESSHPFLYVFLLALLSYMGGIVSFFIGRYLYLIPFIKSFIENQISKHIVNLRKWGGFFIVLGAVSPLPHSLISMTSGLIKYSLRNYLLWSLFRFLRFFIYAVVIFGIL
jgi:membrane protein YqaA with SNARE-associated domain